MCIRDRTNRNLCKRPFFDVIEDLSKKDVKTIVLREKDLSEEEYYEIAEKCKEICDRNGASLTIHNFIDVARRLGKMCIRDRCIFSFYAVWVKTSKTSGV